MAQQTAVEWFRQELLKRDIDKTIAELFEQAFNVLQISEGKDLETKILT